MNKDTVWFVRDGEMQSGWIVSSLLFQFNDDSFSNDSESKSHTLEHLTIMCGVKEKTGNTNGRIPQPIMDMYKRPGLWYLLSGNRLVHCSDVFNTREAAAKNAYESLLNGEGET